AEAALAEKKVQVEQERTTPNVPRTNPIERYEWTSASTSSSPARAEWVGWYEHFKAVFATLVRAQPYLAEKAKDKYSRLISSGSMDLHAHGVLTKNEAMQLISLQRLWKTLNDTAPSHITDDQFE